MKLLLLVSFSLAGLPIRAADFEPFAPAPFQLELPRPEQLLAPNSPFDRRMHLYLPIRPVRVDYGIALRSDVLSNPPKGYFFIDAPSLGYREQRAQAREK